VQALFTNRLHVLRDYRRRVIRPVFHELAKQGSAAVLEPGRTAVARSAPDAARPAGARQLRELLERHEVLRTVVEFRYRLQGIWDETSASHGRALEQLRDLCAQADGSRVQALRMFAQPAA